MSMRVSRRGLLKAVGAIGVGKAMPLTLGAYTLPLAVGIRPAAMPQIGADLTTQHVYVYFTPVEAAFIEAAVDRLIPGDDLGPGALEAGVSFFIDRQLFGYFGTGGNWYLDGPWVEGIPEQGYQMRLVPREIYRMGIDATNRYTQDTHGAAFDQLGEDEQIEVLEGLESGEIELDELPGSLFFEFLYQNTIEGFFADPAYGGNQGMVGWRLVGFPGAAAANYAPLIEEYYDRLYEVEEPVSIGDVQRGDVAHMDLPRPE